jgi:fucose permease
MSSFSLSPAVRVAVYGGFLIIGVVAAMVGPLVPFLMADLRLSYAAAGLLFSAQSVGGLAVLLAGGWLVHVFGKRRILFVGALLFGAGMFVTAFAPEFWTLMAGNVLIGAGMSFLDIGISTLVIDANRDGKGKALNLLHFFFGAGAVLGPLVALVLGHLPSGWRIAFGVIGALPLLLAATVPFLTMPPTPEATVQQKLAVYRRPLLWLGALALFVYCGVEWGVGAWFPSYWKAIPQAASLDPAWATSLFWLTFAVGRFVVGPWADRWGFIRFLSLSIAATLAVCALWVVFPQPFAALIWVLVFGFVIAGQYPTFVALVSQRFPEASGQVTSFLSIFASLGSFVWPPAVGAWADTEGITVLPWAQLAMTVLFVGAAAAAFIAERRTRA